MTTDMSVDALAEIIAKGDDAATNAAHARLTQQVGDEEASRRWSHACSLVDHDVAIGSELTRLPEQIRAAQQALDEAMSSVRSLTGGEAWHVEYAEGPAGGDVAAFLGDAARALRAALALLPSP